MTCLQTAGWVANIVYPDQTPRYTTPDLGLYCLPGLVWQNMQDESIYVFILTEKKAYIKRNDIFTRARGTVCYN